MPIMAVLDRDDASGSAKVLASTAKRCLDGELAPTAHKVALNGLFRLLQAYRAHQFTGYEYQAPMPRGPETLTLMPSGSRHVRDLRLALDRAIGEAYGKEDQERALNQMDEIIVSLARGGGVRPSPEIAKASAFLNALIREL